MPRLAITTGRKHGEKTPFVITGPEVSLDEQKAALRKLANEQHTHPQLAEVQIWTSDAGVTRSMRFRDPAELEKAKAAHEAQAAQAPQTPQDPPQENPPQEPEQNSDAAKKSEPPAKPKGAKK